MNKRWMAILVILATVLGLVASCASPAAPAPTAAPAAAAPTAAPAAAAPTAAPAAAAPTAAPAAASSGTIKIGLITGFTGPYAALGQDQLRGAQLALGEVNNQVNGKQIELIQRDDKLNTQEAAKQAQDLIQNNNVKLLMGCISAATTLSINDIAKRAGVIYMGTCQSNELNKMPDFSPYTFHVALTPYENSQAVGPWLVKNLGKKWYFLMPDYAFGHEWYDGLSKTLKDNGGTDLGVTWAPLGTTDFSPYIPKIQQAKPEVLIAGPAGGDLVNFLKQAKSYGLDKSMKIFSPVVDLPFDIQLGYANIAGTYEAANFTWELADSNSTAKKFVDAYQAKFGAPPSGYAAYAYETVRLLLDAVAKTGGDDPKQVASFLEGYKFNYTGGDDYIRKCDHQVFQPVYILKGRTQQEATAAGKAQFGFRQIVDTIPASDSNERSCQTLGLGNRQ